MKYIFLNHKMNLTKTELESYKKGLKEIDCATLELCIFPSFVNIPYLIDEKYQVGSQNVSSYEEGSYTGEVSAKQLKSIGILYTLVGHSERRYKLYEQDKEIKEKIKELKKQNIVPVLCIGEIEKENREETLKKQLLSVLDSSIENLILAYEPVYSIGTGIVLENSEIEKTVDFIKSFIKKEYNKEFPILYGGSVDEKNIKNIKNIQNIDGVLIGKASLDIEKVKRIMEEVK